MYSFAKKNRTLPYIKGKKLLLRKVQKLELMYRVLRDLLQTAAWIKRHNYLILHDSFF